MIGYAEVVDRMAWPRLKRSRSSAPLVAHEHNGVHVTVAPVVEAGGIGTERRQDKRPANGVRRTMLDGFVPGASVTAVTTGTWEPPDASDESRGTGNGHDAGEIPDDPGDLGIDALFGSSAAFGSGAAEASRDGLIQQGQSAGDMASAASAPAGQDAADAAAEDVAAEEDAAEEDAAEDAAAEDGTSGQASPAPTPVTGPTPTPVIGSTPVTGPVPQPRERLRDVARDSRMRIWRRRILITVIAGAVFSIIFTWRLGLTVAVIVAIADTIYRSRTVAASPAGVKVTGAQRRTQRHLSRMERSGYRALHSRPIPGSEEFIDHLLVGPTGVYAIDSEKWDRRLPIRTRNARQLWHGPESKKDRLEHARWEAEQAARLLSANLGKEITVRPAMAIYGPKVPWDIATIRDVDVFDGTRLRKYLRKRAKVTTQPLPEPEIEKIHQAAMTVLPV